MMKHETSQAGVSFIWAIAYLWFEIKWKMVQYLTKTLQEKLLKDSKWLYRNFGFQWSAVALIDTFSKRWQYGSGYPTQLDER